MKTVIKFFCATLILMIFTGCSTESIDEIEGSSLDNLPTTRAGVIRTIGVAADPMVLALPGDNTIFIGDGSARLVRNQNGISLNINSTGLIPGNAYTAWFIVFDDGPFNFDEFIVVHAAGRIVGEDGEATFSGHLSKGDIGEANGTDILENVGDGSYDNPMDSLVFIHIVDHGEAIPGTIPENIHEITGAISLAQEWQFH
jgi:hypothetical protein